MAGFFESGSEDILYIIIIFSFCIGIIAVALLISKKKQLTKQMAKRRYNTGKFPGMHINYQHEKKLIRRMLPALQSHPGLKAISPSPEKNKIFTSRNDITQCLLLLIKEYSLDSCTIATTDGLVVATTGGNQAQNDAATYSKIKPPDRIPNIPGIIIFKMSVKGSELVGIVRIKNPVSGDVSKKIAADTQTILSKLI